jgi:hypothetical protein
LQEQGHEVRQHNDPEQLIAKGTAALDVGSEVSRVDLGHAGDKGGSEKWQKRTQPARLTIQRCSRSYARPLLPLR